MARAVEERSMGAQSAIQATSGIGRVKESTNDGAIATREPFLVSGFRFQVSGFRFQCWKLEVGSWKLEVGSWKLEVGS